MGVGEEKGGLGVGAGRRADEEGAGGSWDEGVVEGRSGDVASSETIGVLGSFSFESPLLKRMETSLFSFGMREASTSLSLI